RCFPWGRMINQNKTPSKDYAKRGWCAYAPNMFWRSGFTGVVPFEEADRAWHARGRRIQERQACIPKVLFVSAQLDLVAGRQEPKIGQCKPGARKAKPMTGAECFAVSAG